jgi:beta-N-acetylhexosaminidase
MVCPLESPSTMPVASNPLLNQPLEAQLAQRLMIGYPPHQDTQPDPWFEAMLAHGVGGVIFFRPDFDQLSPDTAVQQVLDRHATLRAKHCPTAPALWLGLDQEGGPVERLPQSWFPALLSPAAVAGANVATRQYAVLAESLTALGFNLNFFPTLDVNLTPANPIIGIRAFGHDPDTVWQNGHASLAAFKAAGLVPVIKHFPGHGNGVVDSHEALPTLTFSEQELTPFRQAIELGETDCPVVMVSHGHYPALDCVRRPATLSPVIATELLRDRLGFTGISMTDDMEMGAVWGSGHDPVETALACLNAGMDMLLYRRGDRASMAALWEGLLAAARQGRLDPVQHEAALTRIHRVKAQWPLPPTMTLDTVKATLAQGQETAQRLAQQAMAASPLPAATVRTASAGLPWTLVVPRADVLPHYGYDEHEYGFASLAEVLQGHGLEVATVLDYTVATELDTLQTLLHQGGAPTRLLVVSALPKVGASLVAGLTQADKTSLLSQFPLRLHYPVGVGEMVDAAQTAWFDGQLNAHSYRHPHRQALAQWLKAL